MKLIILAACLAAVGAASGHAAAADGIALEAGSGKATDMVRAGLVWDWQKRWFDGGSWHLGGYWDAELGFWRGHSASGNNQSLADIGLTPVFRLQRNNAAGLAVYVEGAIGFHLLSKTYINAGRGFGSAFQFGNHLGAGLRFGSKGEYDLAYRYQHLSNGDIKTPNQGIDFNQIRFAYRF